MYNYWNTNDYSDAYTVKFSFLLPNLCKNTNTGIIGMDVS